MKKRTLIIISLLLVSFLIFQNCLAQDYSQWGLPEGTIARLGKGWVTDMAFSPDGNQLAVACSIGVWLYNVRTGTEEAFLKGGMELVNSVAYSPDGKILASGSNDWTIRIWDVENRKHIKTLGRHTGKVNSVAFSQDGETIVSGGDDGIRVWNVENWSDKILYKSENVGIINVMYSPDGKTLTSLSKNGEIESWDLTNGEKQWSILGYRKSRNFKLLLPNANKLSSYSLDGKTFANWSGVDMRLYNVVKGNLELFSERPEIYVYSFAFSPDGSKFVTGGEDGSISLWNRETANLLSTLSGHSDAVVSLVYSRDGKIFASASLDGTIRLWGAVGKFPKRTFTGHTYNFDFLAYSPNGKTLASRTKNGNIFVWDAGTFKHKFTFAVHTNNKDILQAVERRNMRNSTERINVPLVYSPDGTTLATADMKNTVRLWDTESGKPKLTFDAKINEEQLFDHGRRSNTITSLAYSPDGKTLVGESRDGKIHFWDLEREGYRQTFAKQEYPSIYLGYSSNDSLITSEVYSKINIWDVPKQQLIRTINIQQIKNGRDGINSISFSPDGKTVAGTSSDVIYLWNTETGTLRQKFSTHSGKVTSVAYSPDGSMLASAGDDNVIRVWNAEAGQRLQTLYGHSNSVTLVAYSPDGNKLASTSDDGTILLWDISNVKQLRELKFGDKKSQNISQWDLPKGASARLGKGLVKDMAYSPDGKHLAVASTIGIWIYDVHTGDERALFTGPVSSSEQILYSPDGRILAGRNSREIYSLDAVTGKYLHTISLNSYHSGSGRRVFVYSQDGDTLASWGHGGSVQLWDAVTGENKHTIEGTRDSYSFAYSPDDTTIAYSAGRLGEKNDIHLWDVTSSKHKKTLTGHKHQVESIIYAPDGKTIASMSKPDGWSPGSSKIDILLWDAETGNLKHTLTYDKYVHLITYSPDGKTLAVESDELIDLWDVLSGKLKHKLLGYPPFVFSPDGKTIACDGYINTISLWNAVSGRPLRSLNGPLGGVTSLRYSPDGKTLTGLDEHNMVCVWDVVSGKLKHTFEHSGDIRTLAYSPDGKTLASGGSDSMIRLWDVDSGTQRLKLNGLGSIVEIIAYSPDGKSIAADSEYNTVLLWDISNGKQKQKFKLDMPHHIVRSIAYSSDGKTLATSGPENTIVLWDVMTGTRKKILTGHTKYVWSVAYSPDGKTLASGSDTNIFLWDASTGEHKRTLSDNTRSAYRVVFSPDGTTLASAGDHDDINLWDLERGKIKSALTHNQIGYQAHTVAYSPDGMMLASGSGNGFIHLWNAHTGKLKKVLYGHYNYHGVNSLVFSPDGTTLASGSWDGTILLWDLTEFKPPTETVSQGD
ncbi:MAG: hypothetical protein OXI43_22535 [Candidatus Poribacteria bacterium]|nr:hypothetical protein [Candidatus Poribacteria bacterium]